jgi:DNA end-binding protein Ku
MWSGSISFGLVNVPVKLFLAVKEQRIQFHMLHDQDHARLQRKMVCSADGKEVHPEHIVKGYEVAPDQYVIVHGRELEALAPKASRTIEIHDFVSVDEIDPLYYDRAYYLAPAEHAAKPYRLLVEAMTKSKRVAIASFVMREKEYLCALRPVDGVICLNTMHHVDEVLPARKVTGVERAAKVDEREVKMAEHLIDSLSGDFDPAKYKDEYRQRVMEMIRKKAKGEEVVTQPPVAEKAPRVVNLMAALEASLAEARKRSRRGSRGASVNGNGHPGAHAVATVRRKRRRS